jgi:hypothetical protein
MAARTHPTRGPICEIGTVEGIVRAFVGTGSAAQVRQCYEDWAAACLRHQTRRGLLVGRSNGDAFDHLAARDTIAAMTIAGIPAGFRLAVVSLDPHLIVIYDAVIVSAARHGIEARRFASETDAMTWLMQ